MTLKDLNIGETAVVGTVGGEGALRQHFLDMGLIPGEEVTLVKFAPMGDPMELSIHGGGCTPAGVLPALYALHRGGGLGQAGVGRQVGVYHGGKSVHRSMAGGLRHAAHHDAVKKTETGSGLQDAGRSFSLDNRCVFVLLLLQI